MVILLELDREVGSGPARVAPDESDDALERTASLLGSDVITALVVLIP